MNGYIGDNFDGGQFRLDPNGAVSTMPGDNMMAVVFYKRPVHHAVLSAQHGRPMYQDVDFVKIQQPGERSTIVDVEAQDTHKKRWPAQWAQYAANKDQVAVGTPLGLLFPRHPSAIANLQGLGFSTVEQLAAASGNAIENIGMNGQDYVNYAAEYLKRSAGGAAFHQNQMELEQVKLKNTRLEDQVAALTSQLQQMQTALSAVGIGQPGAQAPVQSAPVQQFVPPAPAFTPAPAFGPPPVADPQIAQINATHDSVKQKHKGGWPKGKPRSPKTPAAGDAA